MHKKCIKYLSPFAILVREMKFPFSEEKKQNTITEPVVQTHIRGTLKYMAYDIHYHSFFPGQKSSI